MPPLGYFPETHSTSTKGHATWHRDNPRSGDQRALTKAASLCGGALTKEVITRFGQVVADAKVVEARGLSGAFDRRTLRQSNALSNYREVPGRGTFRTAVRDNLEKSLVPKPSGPHSMGAASTGHRSLLLVASESDVNRYTPSARYHHPPTARRPEQPDTARRMQQQQQQQPSSTTAQAPYLWKPGNPDSVTYGFHRRW